MDVATSPMTQSDSEEEETGQTPRSKYASSTPAPFHPEISATIRVGGKDFLNKENAENIQMLGNGDRQKTCLGKHPTGTSSVQISKRSADSFFLPRENTTLTSKQIDFTEMEVLRVSKSRSPNRIPTNNDTPGRGQGYSKSSDSVLVGRSKRMPPSSQKLEISPSRLYSLQNMYRIGDNRKTYHSPGSLQSGIPSESTAINISRSEPTSQQGMAQLPLWTRTSESSLTDYRLWNTPELREEIKLPRPKPPHVLMQNYTPSNSIPRKNKEANFVVCL